MKNLIVSIPGNVKVFKYKTSIKRPDKDMQSRRLKMSNFDRRPFSQKEDDATIFNIFTYQVVIISSPSNI